MTACALGLTALYLWVGDLTTLGEWVTVWPSVGWVALLLTPAVVSRRPVALGSLLAFLLLTTEWPRLSPAGTTAKPDLRVAVWNVAGNAAAFDALAAYSPDVVLVQECVKPQRGWSGYSWHPALDPAILSRLPVQPLPTESIGPWTDPQLAIVTLTSGRRVLFVNVRLALPSLIITAANLSGFELPGNHRQRIDQFPRLRNLIEKTAAREGVADVVLGGDFNTPPTARSLAPLRPALRDVWPEAGVGWGGTAPEFLPLSRIDQCWVSARLRPLQARVVRLPGSDHRALLVDLALHLG